jgi:Zn-dependent oligopeptidase
MNGFLIFLRGTNVERDFVEAPSQMLENWVWNKDSLKLLSAHYKDGSSIDENLLNDLIKTKNTSSGCFNMRFNRILFHMKFL